MLAQGRALFALLALCGAMCASASTPPFVIALPFGYYLQRGDEGEIDVVRRNGHLVLHGPIAAYAVFGYYVTGCVGHWPKRSFAYPNELPFPGSPDARYFVLDTRTGQLEKDLDEAAWKSRLAALGAPRSLAITAPILPS